MMAKLIFKKYFIIALLLVLQVVLVILFAFLLRPYFVFYWICVSIISIIALIDLINMKSNASLIIPWLFLFIVFPLVGLVLFLFLKFNSKSLKKYNNVLNINNKANLQTNNKLFLSIERLSNLNSYHGDCEYFAWGNDFFEQIKNDLKNAKHYVIFEFFIIENGILFSQILNMVEELIEKGVEVYMMYDDFGCANKLANNFCSQMEIKGIKCCKFTSTPSLIHNNRDHRKVCVIDGEIAFTGGANIADEYVGEKQRFGIWKDSGIKIKGEGVSQYVQSFFALYCLAKNTDICIDNYLHDNKTNKEANLINIFGAPLKKEETSVCQNSILNLLDYSQNQVDITTPYLVLDYLTKNVLIRLASRGIKIRIFVPMIPDKKIVNLVTKMNYYNLIENGVEIYEFNDGFIHSKNILVDNEIGMVGSINFDYRSFNHHFECATIFKDCIAVNQLKEDFDFLIKNSKKITENQAKKYKNKFICKFLKILAPLM